MPTILAKSPGILCIFLFGRNMRSSPPLKQCWFLGEVHGVMEKFFVCNNAKCLRYRPRLFKREGKRIQGVMVEMLIRL